MAILNNLRKVEVTVNVDGQPLQEHIDRQLTDPPEMISRYIEIQSDQKFEIQIQTSRGAIRGAGHKHVVEVDGNRVDWFVVEPRHCDVSPKISVSNGTRRHEGRSRPYKFKVFTTDEDGSKDRTEQTRQLGTIDVRIYELSSIKRLPVAREPTLIFNNSAPLEPLSEKAVKFQELSHTVGFGDAVRARRKKRMHSAEIKYASDMPVATYRFYYRSRESLQNLDIIPRTPPPPGLEGVGDEIKLEEQEEKPRPKKAARRSGEKVVIELDSEAEKSNPWTPFLRVL